MHSPVHTEDKPYPCHPCPKAFSENGSLKIHLRVQTGKKYAFNQCPKTFPEKDNLKNHLRTHRGEKPHPCNQCQKYFSEDGACSIILQYIQE